MKLRTRLFLIFSILAIIPLCILTFFSYNRYCQATTQRMDEITDRLFENAAVTANRTLNGIGETITQFNFYGANNDSLPYQLRSFSNSDQIPDIYDYYTVSKSFTSQCQTILYSNDTIYGIYFFTPSGYNFSYSNSVNGSLQPNYDPKTSQWYQETLTLDGSMYVSMVDAHDLFTGNKRSVFFACSIKDVYTHHFLGVLLIDCDPSIVDLSIVNTLPKMALLTISNKNTDDILYTNYDETGDFHSSNTKILRQDLDITPLQLTAVFDYESLFREYNVTAVLLILVAVICMIGFLILAYFSTRQLVYPIEHLSRKMASQKGHTLEQTGRFLNRSDEIGTLYNEYNAMIDSLNQAVKEDYQDKLITMDAQMKSLEARINSHFLFNTLEAINSMAEIDENEQIATMSLALGNMFRYTLKTKSELVSMEEELEHVRDYYSIQSIRFDNRFSLIVDIDHELRRKKILKLVLQPLVENALYHGLNYCTLGNEIRIRGSMDERNIYLDVWDNGRGMTSEVLDRLNTSLQEEASFTELGHRNKQSIGLKNIHSRIQLYYGKGYGLHITSCEGEWTNIRIHVPILFIKEEV
ncbi:MAG: sensor histidine kinase [Eubacteriales bacterium]|nr:sensor histidine kinase [Eubacteriales bacterium]